jgi:orotidine-5'-phosphate decarboxylase
MAERNFRALIEGLWQKDKFVCVGLDTDLEKIPESARQNGVRETIVGFNRAIIDTTRDLVCAYKPNVAFYEARGDEGWKALRETIQYIHEATPEIPVILDAKRGDMGNTNLGYVQSVFEFLKADAVTVHPYLGREGLAPFLDQKDKGIFVLCRTSNEGAKEFQDLKIDNEPLYKIVARHVVESWNGNNNCGLVVGATYPEELREVREIAKQMPILLPGIGTQNGDLQKSISNGKDSGNTGLIVSASRAVIFASTDKDFAVAARNKVHELNKEIADALLK